MTRTARTIVFGVGALCLGVFLVLVFLRMPEFGGSRHAYRDASVGAALRQVTPNVVASINFDQRALDTLGEEIILFGSVIGAATLLRLGEHERRRPLTPGESVLPSTRLLGYLLLPVLVLLGLDVIAHGHLTPGGGFQGGVVLASGVHLSYLAGSYRALRRLRPLDWYNYAEALGAGAFVALGCAGMVAGGAFLANFLPHGQFTQLFSTGTVAVLSIAVGVAVTAGAVVLLAQFLEQAMAVQAEEAG
ncbi:MAG TPA: MnhB domain-containing protein [Actinophytocola sp.]|jgi:multicomponent Na+:H+ antiporter subunit B|uniref:MnhB domain-containing protein n=1 Tax=Actinophytocola sp. TaxID=1872138 RepID=UPI002F91E6D0